MSLANDASIFDSEIVKQGFETVLGGETGVGQITLDAGPGRMFGVPIELAEMEWREEVPEIAKWLVTRRYHGDFAERHDLDRTARRLANH